MGAFIEQLLAGDDGGRRGRLLLLGKVSQHGVQTLRNAQQRKNQHFGSFQNTSEHRLQ